MTILDFLREAMAQNSPVKIRMNNGDSVGGYVDVTAAPEVPECAQIFEDSATASWRGVALLIRIADITTIGYDEDF